MEHYLLISTSRHTITIPCTMEKVFLTKGQGTINNSRKGILPSSLYCYSLVFRSIKPYDRYVNKALGLIVSSFITISSKRQGKGGVGVYCVVDGWILFFLLKIWRYDMTNGNSVNHPRQQINQVTSYLDGSSIYGTTRVWSQLMRLGKAECPNRGPSYYIFKKQVRNNSAFLGT